MWKKLTPELLQNALSGAEMTSLAKAATANGQVNVLETIGLEVAESWRGGLRRVTTVDSREGYVPSELLPHILADYRQRVATRLPGMSGLIDDLRQAEWARANTVRDNLAKETIADPEDEYAETAEESGRPQPAIADPAETSILGGPWL